MSAETVKQARRVLDRLRDELGGECAFCGHDGTVSALEFDCKTPCGHKHHAAGMIARAYFYQKQAARHNLQLLCRSCHALKSELEGLQDRMRRRASASPF